MERSHRDIVPAMAGLESVYAFIGIEGSNPSFNQISKLL